MPAERERTLRRELAAALRLAARAGWTEAVANHFSVAVAPGSPRFLVNPRQVHFANVTASSLICVDSEDAGTMDRPDAPDPTAWALHGALHRKVPHARCVIHTHAKHATVLACLADSRMPAIDQNTAAFHDRVLIDTEYGGLAFAEEGARIAAMFTDPRKRVMVMGNHGVLVLGETVAEAFDRHYYFERAAETLITAYMTGRPLRVLSDAVAERTAAQNDAYPQQAERHFAEMMTILDREEPDYRD
jgi:ribulose-5-phosphate 4-epimerase/fuculose-1-phosphate aldolase